MPIGLSMTNRVRTGESTTRRGGRCDLARLLHVALALGLTLFFGASSIAGQGGADLLTPAERTWLAGRSRIVLGAADDWAVAAKSDARGGLSGPFVEYLDLLNQKLGTDIKIEAGPWQEIVKRAEAREIDGLALTAPLEERKKHFLFSSVFHVSPEFIYLRTDDLHQRGAPTDLGGLSGRRVGYVKGSLRSERALAAHPKIVAMPFGGFESLADALLRGNIDAAIAVYGFEYWRASNGVVGMAITRIAHEVDGSMVMSIDRNQPELLGILDKGIAAISRDELERILRRWFGNDYSDRAAARYLHLNAEERAWLAEHPVVRVGIGTAWAPVEFVDEGGTGRGISLAYLDRLGKMLAIRFESAPQRSWTDALDALERRRVDMLPAIAGSGSTERSVHSTEPYLSIPAAIFTAADVTYIGGPEGLSGKTVCVVRGDAVQRWLQDAWPGLRLLPVDDTRSALKAITQGRAYAFVGNLVTTSYYIGDAGLSQVRVAGETQFDYRLAMGVRSDWPVLARILQKGIDAIPKAERDAIYRDWISIRYEHRVNYAWLWTVAGAAVLILLLVFAERSLRLNLVNSRLQRLARELSQVEERERRRLAGELHDSPMQKLALAQLQFSAASGEIPAGPAARLANGLGLMREALDELHTLQFELSPPLLYREGLASALEWLAAHATERFGVAFEFQDAGLSAKVPQDLAILLFQIARELVYNVAKHAAARTGSIALDTDGKNLVLSVSDDGRGFGDTNDARRRRPGFGLFSVRERVHLFGGDILVATTASGSSVSVRIPLLPISEAATDRKGQASGSPQASGSEFAR